MSLSVAIVENRDFGKNGSKLTFLSRGTGKRATENRTGRTVSFTGRTVAIYLNLLNSVTFVPFGRDFEHLMVCLAQY